MSKGLKALEDIKYKLRELEYVCRHSHGTAPFIQEEKLNIIEQELKRIEELENRCSKAGITIDDYFKYLIEETIDNYKKLKTLEIMQKEPYISVNWYLEGTYEEYINAIEVVKITEDEWNFVKEVLL